MALTKSQQAELSRALDERRAALLEDVHDELDTVENVQYVELIDRSPADLGDQSIADQLADLNLAIIDRQVREIREIEEAKAWMNAGSYGTCASCGGDIAFERLRAYPTAKRCVRCQRQHEKTYGEGHAPPTL